MSERFDIRHVVSELRRRRAPEFLINDIVKDAGWEGVHDLGDGNVVLTDFGPRSIVRHGTVNGTGTMTIVDEWVIDAPRHAQFLRASAPRTTPKPEHRARRRADLDRRKARRAGKR